MNRNDFKGGPGTLTWNGVTFQLVDDWEAQSEIRAREVRTNLQGLVGKREDYAITRITAKPIAFTGSLSSLFTKLFPYSPASIGNLIFPATDLPAVIQTKDGKSITYSAAAITTMPPLQFSPMRELIGQVVLTCIRKAGVAADDAAAHVAVGSSAYSEPTADLDDISAALYTGAWGSTSPFDDIETDEEGFTFTPQVQLSDLLTARDGLLNQRVQGVTAEVRFVPVNIDVDDFYDDFLQLDGSNAGRGKLLKARGQELTVTGDNAGDPVLTIPRAVPITGPARLSQANSRVGQVTLEAHRHDLAGVLQSLFTLGVVPA